jgi:GTPase SAR1 family protein
VVEKTLTCAAQIVVVGSQSSGKSSLLENLTGFAFPRSQGVCTRYATQITLRRNADKYIVISIIPWRDSDSARKDRLRGFRYELDEFDPKELADIIEKVCSSGISVFARDWSC